MKVLHICTQDFGGAGIAARQLHLGLKLIGIESKMLVLDSSSSDSDIVSFARDNNILKRIGSRLRRKLISLEFNAYKNTRSEGLEKFSDDRTVYDVSKHFLILETDIVHLHWIAGMVNYTEFFLNIVNKPVVWTLHDMNPFTGGCHYAGDCKKYEIGCGACPQLGLNNTNDLSRRIFKRKEKAYKGRNLHITTGSNWLADCAKRSKLFKDFKIEIIPPGLSTSIFTKRDKQYSRQLLGLPENKVLVLFGADYKTKRKGLKYLLEALRMLKEKIDTSNIALVIFGNCINSFPMDIGIPIYILGRIGDERLLSCCYSAADMFIMPSLEEAYGQTCLEAMACGTAVVGSDVGGIPDMIISQGVGLLAKARDTEDLSGKIRWMIEHPEECERMGLNAQKIVEQEHTLELEAKRYLKLYDSISRL